MEIWKQFRDANYEISTLGQVRHIKTKRILKQQLHIKGYLRVSFEIKGVKRHFNVHRLVCETFLDIDITSLSVDHINRVRNDNRLENLRVVSQYINNQNRVFKTIIDINFIKEIIHKHKIGLSSEDIFNSFIK